MTCIVGIADGKNVWIGGDTCGSDYQVRMQVAHPKVFVKKVDTYGAEEQLLIGGCGSFRMLQLLEYSLEVPAYNSHKQTVVAWLATDFIEAVRTLFKNKGLLHAENGVESILGDGSSFLVGFRGQLHHIYSDCQAFPVKEQEDAAGSGTLFALGSLHTSRELGWSPVKRIDAALKAAATINPFVAGPFDILSI